MKDKLQILLEESKDLHLEICNNISLLKKQSESETGLKLVSLKDFRRLTLRVSKLDLQIRAVTIEKSKAILERNSKKNSQSVEGIDGNAKA